MMAYSGPNLYEISVRSPRRFAPATLATYGTVARNIKPQFRIEVLSSCITKYGFSNAS